MSADTTGATQGPTSTTNTFAGLWFDYLEKTGAQSNAWFEGIQTLTDPRNLQQAWLEALSRSLDTYLRTPAFLELLRQNLETVTTWKKHQDQFIEDSARQVGAPLASDIFGLFERLESLQRATLARLSSIEARCAAIEAELTKNHEPAPS